MTEVQEPVDISDGAAGASVSLASAPSELAQHSETIESWERDKGEEQEDDPWVFAMPNESLESFAAAFPPSTTEKSWISTEHVGRKKMIEEYYATSVGAEGPADKGKIASAWEQLKTKSTESLTRILKEHKYGCASG